LTGTIPENLGQHSKLMDLSISNNELVGNIPLSIQHNSFNYLDLSSNRLNGVLVNDFVVSDQQTYLALAVNRLSGPLPDTFKQLSSYPNLVTVNVLASNIFSCSSDDIPSVDEDADSYFCGSYDQDIASYAFAAILASIILFSVLVYMSLKHCKLLMEFLQALLDKIKFWWIAASFDRSIQDHSFLSRYKDCRSKHGLVLRESLYFLLSVDMFMWIACVTGIIVVVVILPVYIGLSYSSSIVSHSYGYIVSMALLHGLPPVLFLGLLIPTMTLTLGLCQYIIREIFFSRTTNRSKSLSTSPIRSKSFIVQRYCCIFFLNVINIAVTVCVNAVYVSFVFNDSLNPSTLVAFQAVLSLFKLLWNSIFIPFASTWMATFTSQSSAMRLRFFLSTTNFIFAPLIASITTNKSCFYYAFNKYSSITTEISVTECITYITCNGDDNGGACTSSCIENLIVSTSTTSPTFTYSYACGSAIIEAYIPVLLYSFIVSGIVLPIFRMLVMCNMTTVKSYLGPKYYAFIEDQLLRIKGRESIVRYALNVTIMLSFGIASCVLGVCLAVGIVIDWSVSRLTFGRNFDLYSSEKRSDSSIGIELLGLRETGN
jgi:hypothetical protein